MLISFVILIRDSLNLLMHFLPAAYFAGANLAFPAASSLHLNTLRLIRARPLGRLRNARTIATVKCRFRLPVKNNKQMTNTSFIALLELKFRRYCTHMYRQVLEYFADQVMLRSLALKDGYHTIARVSAYPAEMHPCQRDLRLMPVRHRFFNVPFGILYSLVLRYQEEVLFGFLCFIAPFTRHYTLYSLDQNNVFAGRIHSWWHRITRLHADEKDDYVFDTRSKKLLVE